jgi:hypothetical protein
MVKKTDDALYLFTVDMKGKATQARFTIKDVNDARVEVLDENRSISVKDGTFSDDVEAWGVHLYKLMLNNG